MILTVANHKGGVGKTAIAAHLAFWAAEQGHRVLAVDFDSQANLTDTLIERDLTIGAPNAADLFGRGEVPSPSRTPIDNVDLLPACAEVDNVEKGHASSRFAAIEGLKTLASRYDVIVIDTPPQLGLRLEVALTVSDRVIAPLLPEKYSIDGLNTLVELIDNLRRHSNPRLEAPQFVLNLVNPQASSHRAVMEALTEIYPMAAGPLYRHIAVVDALADRRPVWRRGSSTAAAKEWKDACAALLKRRA